MAKNQDHELAVQQLIGFAHARAGYDVQSLAESMGLTGNEWAAMKSDVKLRPEDEAALDALFL